MSGMFNGCNSLKSLNLSNFITSSVTDMSKMFYNCNSLNVLDISNFDMRGIDSDTSEDMFENMDQLKYLNIYNLQDNNIISRSALSNKNDLISCQKNDNNQMTVSICCDYNIGEGICEENTNEFNEFNEFDFKFSILNENYNGENIIMLKDSFSIQLSKLNEQK